ncbi:MAG: carboxypeptidase regulatory-like domain-containing protein [Bacteroidetes bacterium]|nr:carboxypeptidase regulatory-like domain-containing protein [Bacteroidota bacterium]
MKTQIPFIVLLLLGLLPGISCEKEPMPTVVKGCITEYGSGKPLEGAVVYLIGGLSQWGSSTGTPGVDSVLTDSAGFYYLESFEDLDYFIVRATGELYYTSENTSSGVIPGKENTINIVLDPVGWIHYRVFNESGEGVLGWNSICSDMPGLISGGVDLEFVCPIHANRDVLINYAINNGGIDTPYAETRFVPAHDTIYYEIIF